MRMSLAIKRIRVALGFSQEDFSFAVGIPESTVGSAETELRPLSDKNKERVKKVFGISDTQLFVLCTESVSDFRQAFCKLPDSERKGILSIIFAQYEERDRISIRKKLQK